MWQKCLWTLARRVIVISQFCHEAASHIAQHPRLLRNSLQKGDLRKWKILPWQLWYYIFVCRHIFTSSRLSHFRIRIRLLRLSFLRNSIWTVFYSLFAICITAACSKCRLIGPYFRSMKWQLVCCRSRIVR
jgi:hypothetical protein